MAFFQAIGTRQEFRQGIKQCPGNYRRFGLPRYVANVV